MSILINKETRVLVQGITGKEGLYHSELMRNYWHKDCGRCDSGQGRRLGAG